MIMISMTKCETVNPVKMYYCVVFEELFAVNILSLSVHVHTRFTIQFFPFHSLPPGIKRNAS